MTATELLTAMAKLETQPAFENLVSDMVAHPSGAVSGAKRVALPMSMSSFSQETIERFSPYLEQLGFVGMIDADDAARSVLSYRRSDGHSELIVVLNFTPTVHEHYRIRVPQGGRYREIFNSDAREYGGSGIVSSGELQTTSARDAQELVLKLPPLGGIVLASAPPAA